MNLDQTKLTKSEWDSIEVPVSPEELSVLKMIREGYHDTNVSHNGTNSLMAFLKLKETDSMHQHLFAEFMAPKLKESISKHGEFLDDDFVKLLKDTLAKCLKVSKKAKKVSKADIFRLENSAKTLDTTRGSDIFEFVLINTMDRMLEDIADENNLAALTPFYTLNRLCTYDVHQFSEILKNYLVQATSYVKQLVKPRFVVAQAANIFEKNQLLLKYANQTLYSHQKKLFTVMKRPGKKLVLYTAPTGTGKTMSPIGLAEGKKVIFVCAARHVGLALARAALSVGRKIAFAFGCQTADDVRLHYAAATEFTKDWKTGGIRKVDNSVGDKVEMIICDVRSYKSAMYYMNAFTEDPNDIVMYWDEPTISLDYESHPLHQLMADTWKDNIVPNIVLSSATLPSEEDLAPMLNKLKSVDQFSVYPILSQDFKKTIPLLGPDNAVKLPHVVAESASELRESAIHCLTHNSIMRYIDVGGAAKFITAVRKNENAWLTDRAKLDPTLKFDNVFPTIESVTLQSIKKYYCELIANMDSELFPEVRKAFLANMKPRYESVDHITTSDAHTITGGPALYLAKDVHAVANDLLSEANISKSQLDALLNGIRQNNQINTKIDALQKQLDDQLKVDENKDKKADLDNRKLDKGPRQMLRAIENLQSMIKVASLDDSYIPNKRNHLRKHAPDLEVADMYEKPYCSDIPEGVVEEIMMINGIDDSWKILLMMGIGVFAADLNPTYAEIMKDLADTQQLYLIIASTDYIYGTNYQFCHGYIGEDLGDISQEKCIQALGRIGRNKLQFEYTLRFKSDDLLKKLFFKDDDKPEAHNMNRLFS
jgi:hypothetical protein